MDKSADKSVKLDKKERKLLLSIDKESKWKEVKSIDSIKNALEDLQIDNDFIGLGCSRYLNEAGTSGKFDVEDMFRNCREAEKVRKRKKKEIQREEKSKQRQGRGASGRNDSKLLQQQAKADEDSKLAQIQKPSDFDKSLVSNIRKGADEISKVIGTSANPEDWTENLVALGLKTGFETLVSLLIALAETYPKLFRVVGGTMILTTSALSLYAKLYGVIETGNLINKSIDYITRKIRALLGWLRRNGMDGLVRRRRRNEGGGGSGGGNDDDDDDDNDDNDGNDFLFDGNVWIELQEKAEIEQEEQKEEEEPKEEQTTTQQSSSGNVMTEPSLPTPQSQNDALAEAFTRHYQREQQQHIAKAVDTNTQNLFKKNPIKEEPTEMGELQTRAEPITAERIDEEMGQGEKVKPVEGAKMETQSSDLTGINKATTTSQKIMGTAFTLGGMYHVYNSIVGNQPDTIPVAPVVVQPDADILARPFRQPPHGGIDESLFNRPQQPSTARTGNLLEPQQNVRMEIRDLGMDGEPLDRSNLQPRHQLERLNERIGSGSATQTTTMEQQTDLTSQNLEEMREGEEARKTEIDQQTTQLEQQAEEIEKMKKEAEEAHRKEQEQEQKVRDFLDRNGRNGEAWGVVYGMMGGQGGQGKTLQDSSSLISAVMRSADVRERQQTLQNIQANSLLQTRGRVNEEDRQEQMALLQDVEAQALASQQNAQRGLSEAHRQLERTTRLYEAEQELRPPQGSLQMYERPQGRGRNVANRINMLFSMSGIQPTSGERRTAELREAVSLLLEEITEYNPEEIRNFINEDVFGAGTPSATEIMYDTGSANNFLNNIFRVLNNNDRIREAENNEIRIENRVIDEQNRERRLRGEAPLPIRNLKKSIIKRSQKSSDIISKLITE